MAMCPKEEEEKKSEQGCILELRAGELPPPSATILTFVVFGLHAPHKLPTANPAAWRTQMLDIETMDHVSDELTVHGFLRTLDDLGVFADPPARTGIPLDWFALTLDQLVRRCGDPELVDFSFATLKANVSVSGEAWASRQPVTGLLLRELVMRNVFLPITVKVATTNGRPVGPVLAVDVIKDGADDARAAADGLSASVHCL